jgi:hypothetical protein
VNFECEVTSGSTDFLDLSGGAKISVSNAPGGVDLSTGFLLAHEAVEEWSLMRRKKCSVRATHYPDATDEENGPAAGTMSAFEPSQNLNFLFPGNTLIYSTVGLTHASGLIHQLQLTQRWEVTDDEPSPDGQLLGAFISGYERVINLTLLAKPSAAVIPAPRSVLTISGAPGRMSNFRVISAEPKLERKKGMMFTIEAAWIPPLG